MYNVEVDLKEFGANLKRIRKEKKITLEELALKTELDDSQISKIEKGLRDIRLSTVIKLIRGLGVEANDLFVKIK
jgi:transcriptional regulator with XRE-family HTH domain